ncbi:hypothetical protein BH24ACI2_BH24ACI2_09750 [soil metagenome]
MYELKLIFWLLVTELKHFWEKIVKITELVLYRNLFCSFFCAVCLLCGAVSGKAQEFLTVSDVQTVIAQAVSASVSLNQKVTVAVTDHEGNVVGIFVMTGAPMSTQIRSVGANGQGLEGVSVPATFAAISKAGTASLFGTDGNAFTTRTAGFIIQEHFPPTIDFREGGPLYGVQFSSLACSDVAVAGLPLGLSGDPGGIPLYKNGKAVGGVGIEGDGLYTVDREPYDNDQPFEEIIAVSASRGYEPPALIRADNILVVGIRFPYSNVPTPLAPAQIPFSNLPGMVTRMIRPTQPSAFTPAVLNGVPGETSNRFPIIGGSNLSAAEVTQILGDAARTANNTRAGIRQPLGSNARVTMAVVDVDGKVLGIFRQQQAPVFGYDVAVQKARTSVFMSRPDAAVKLSTAGFGNFVSRATADSIGLNGATAFSDRGFGFLHRPFFPDGINGTAPGPFSTPIENWSPFNVGLQLDLIKAALLSPPMMCSASKRSIKIGMCTCTAISELKNGIQIFAGGIPLYRNGVLVGGIGISGDGIDQDDFIAAGGANSFAPPVDIRSDRLVIRNTRLPFLKFPTRPTL